MIVAFILLTYGLSTLLQPFLPPDYLDLVMFVPGVVAIALMLWKKESLRSLFKLGPLTDLLWGVAIPLLVTLFIVGFSLVFSLATYACPQDALKYCHGNVGELLLRLLVLGLPYTLALNSILALGEEIGWRGYLLKNLKGSVSNFYIRALLVGLIWGLWHVPMYLQMGTSSASLCLFLGNVCLFSIICTWLYEKHNSIWPTVLFHAMHNLLFNYWLPLFMVPTTPFPLFLGEEGLMGSCYSLVVGGIIWWKHRISSSIAELPLSSPPPMF